MISYLQTINVLPNLQTKPEGYEVLPTHIWWQMERRRRGRKLAVYMTAIGYDTSYNNTAPEGWTAADVSLEEATMGFFQYYSTFDFANQIISIRVSSPSIKIVIGLSFRYSMMSTLFSENIRTSHRRRKLTPSLQQRKNLNLQSRKKLSLQKAKMYLQTSRTIIRAMI